MPTYKITDPTTGKSIRITGDSPPSESELNDIFSGIKGSGLRDAPNSPAAPAGAPADPMTRELAVKMAKFIFEGGGSNAMQAGASLAGINPAFSDVARAVVPGVPDFASGTASGLKREDSRTDGSASRKAGEIAGRIAPAVAGTAVASALTGGAGLIPAAMATGLGGAAGEAYGQLGARVLGGKAPQTSEAAAWGIGKAGAEALTSELAVGTGLRLGAATLKATSQGLVGISPRSMTRVIERYKDSPMIRRFVSAGPDAKAGVEREGINSLKRIQEGVERVRSMKGQAVDNALVGLSRTTQGQRVADVSGAIQATEDFLRQPGIDASKGVAKEVANLLNDLKSAAGSGASIMGASGNVSALSVKDLIAFRRRVDRLGEFAKRAMGEADRDVGVAAAREMGAALRQSVADVATASKNTQLLKANADFSDFVRTYDELGDFFGSKSRDVKDMLLTLNKASRDFGAGGMTRETLLSAKDRLPFVAKDIDNLLDAVSVRAFTADPKYTPSGNIRALLRQLVTPQRSGQAIAILKKLEKAKPGMVAGMTAGTQAVVP